MSAGLWATNRARAGLLAVIAAVALCYAHTLRVPLLLDDTATIGDSPSLHDLRRLGDVLQPPPWSFAAGRPLLNLSFALNYHWGGTDVPGYHRVNIGIHLLNTMLLAALVRRLLAPADGTVVALGAALLWGVQPLHTGSVTYLSQRAEILMASCCLGALLAFVRGCDAPRGRWWHALAIGASLAGGLVKEVAVVMPVACLLVDGVFRAGSLGGALRRRGWVYAGLGATWLVTGYVMHQSGLAARLHGTEVAPGVFDLARIQLKAWGEYLQLAVWPHPLVFDRGTTEAALAGYSPLRGLGLVTVGVAATAWAWRRDRRVGLLGVLFGLFLLPTSSVIPVLGQPIAENRLYLPLAAWSTGLALGLVWTLGPRRAVLAILGLAGALAVQCWDRNADFRSAETIWRDTIAKAPANPRAHGSLGIALLNPPARREEAIRHLLESRRLAPAEPMTAYWLGQAYAGIPGGAPAAIASYRECLRLDPRHALAHAQLGLLLLQAGQPAEALPHVESAVRLRPDRSDFRIMLGALWRETPGRAEEARAMLEQAVREDPQNAMGHLNLANLLLDAPGQQGRAIEAFRAATRLAPHDPLVWYGLGNALIVTRGDRTEARAALERALQLAPNFPPARERLRQLENP